MILGYNRLPSIFSVCIVVFFIGCNKDMKTQETSSVEKTPAVAENIDPDCVEYVALWAAGDIQHSLDQHFLPQQALSQHYCFPGFSYLYCIQ